MKKTLFLSAILGAALCSSAFAEDKTYTGSSSGNMDVSAYSESDTITFKLNPNASTAQGQGNWFASAKSTAAKILIEDDASTEGVVEGLNISNGNTGTYVTFSGAVSGNGSIQKIGNGTNLAFNFTGNVTEYTGDITLSASAPFYLFFGSDARTNKSGITDYGTAGTAPTTSTTKGASGTGNITFTTGNNTVVYNYADSENPVYITNTIAKTGGTSKVEFRGGASYELRQNATIDVLTLADGSDLKYTGTNQMVVTGGSLGTNSVLEGVITNGTSNIRYEAQYGVNAGTLKNVMIHNLNANDTNSSITLDGVYGYFAQNSVQRNLTLTGGGLTLSAGYNGTTTTIQKLDGSGNIVSNYTNTDSFIIQDATAWTGTFSNMAGTVNLTFNGNTNAQIEAKTTINTTLKGSDYSNTQISGYNNSTSKVTVTENSGDVTIKQIIQDPSGKTKGHINVELNNGLKTAISQWATVDSVTLKNSSSLQLNRHNIGTITVESGKSTVTSGAAIGSGDHRVGTINLNDNADLTVTGGNNNATITGLSLGGGSTITLGSKEEGGHNYLLTLQDLTVGAAEEGHTTTINANLKVTGTMDFTSGGVLTMGCSVELGDDVTVTLSADAYDYLANRTDGDATAVTLFNSVEGYTGSDIIHVTGAGAGQDGWFFLNYTPGEQGGTLSLVPEPATATLSLLALAALAARRRRH